jgi:hypothetical protein
VRGSSGRWAGWMAVWGVVGWLVGTQVGRALAQRLGPWGHALVLGPSQLNLDVVRVAVTVRTNLLGLVLLAVGLALGARR